MGGALNVVPALLAAVLLGVIEGITEFLPISSTGHLIVAGDLLGTAENLGPAFEIFIQLGAIAAVIWYYREPLTRLALELLTREDARLLVGKLFLSFLPAAVFGLAFHRVITQYLFAPFPVAVALAFGGVVLILADGPQRGRGTADLRSVSWTQALVVGFAQVASLWPGISRSGATIVGGLLAGMSRPVALEFSFYLAIPTMVAACLYSLFQARSSLDVATATCFAVGFLAAFVSALIVVRALISLVKRRDLRPFGWYRIVVGMVVVVTRL